MQGRGGYCGSFRSMQAVCIVAKLKGSVKVATVAGVVRRLQDCVGKKACHCASDVKAVGVVCGGDLEVKTQGGQEVLKSGEFCSLDDEES